jgi:hypothetical protein
MTLSPRHRRLLWLDQGVGSAVFNFLLNAGIAWLLFHSVEAVPLWGQLSIAGDTVATAFILPLLTSLVVSRMVAGQVAAGHIPPLSGPPDSRLLAALAGRSALGRGALLGAVGMLAAAAPVIGWLQWAGPRSLDLGAFLWFKASFAGALAAVVTPVIGLSALLRASPRAAS